MSIRNLAIGSIAVLTCALVGSGCGSGEASQTAKAGDAGAYVQDVEKARSVADEASNKIKSGEKEVYGDSSNR